MRESHVKGPATHEGPESCGASRKGGVEALRGVRAGRVFSRERNLLRDADAVGGSGRPSCPSEYVRFLRPGAEAISQKVARFSTVLADFWNPIVR
jgi:hypothetical protein